MSGLREIRDCTGTCCRYLLLLEQFIICLLTVRQDWSRVVNIGAHQHFGLLEVELHRQLVLVA